MNLQTLINPVEVTQGGMFRPTPANARFDASQLGPHIRSAELLHIVPLLGADLYHDMITVKAGRISQYNPNLAEVVTAFPTNTPYETLWRIYLLELCGLCVLYEALPFIVAQIGASGVFFANTEYAQNVGEKGGKYLQDTLKRRIQAISEATRVYLCENKATYTAFDSKGCPSGGCGEEEKQQHITQRFGMFYSTNR